MKDNDNSPAQQLRLRLPVAVLGILICLLAIWFSMRVGYSRLMARYASLTNNVAAGQKAIDLTPLDPHAHSVKAAVLYNNGVVAEAARELEVAVSLRPKDDALWLKLGMIRDELQNPEALLAFNESVRLAPYYAHPRWQRGNYLLRSGRFEEAFVDLRTAAASNLTLIPTLIDLAWAISKENSSVTERWAGITDDRMRIAFARFLTTKGRAQEALDQFRSSKVVSQQARRELMQDLIAAGAFREAYEIWAGIERADNGRLASVHDGDFESVAGFDETGFGWRFSQTSPGVKLSLDPRQSQTGKRSLLVSFVGYSESTAILLSQLILVEPSKHYQVKFGARAQDIVTGGVPVINVNDGGGQKKLLGQSEGIGMEKPEWKTVTFDFKTNSSTQAVQLSLQRKPCNTAPCPIFGSLWLDNVSLTELKERGNRFND